MCGGCEALSHYLPRWYFGWGFLLWGIFCDGWGGAVCSYSSVISFSFRIEKYVLSIDSKNLAFISSAPLTFFCFGGGMGKSDTLFLIMGGRGG